MVVDFRIHDAQILVADDTGEILRRLLRLTEPIIDGTDEIDDHVVRHRALRIVLFHDGLVIELRHMPHRFLLMRLVSCRAIDPAEMQVEPRAVRERSVDELRIVDGELIGGDGLRHAAHRCELERELTLAQELADLLLIARGERREKMLLVRREAAVLAEPDMIIVGIDALIVNAEILVRLLRDDPRFQLDDACRFTADRARLLNDKCIFPHACMLLP